MLRRSARFGAPVFIQLMDTSRMQEMSAGCKAGVAFTLRVELGDGVERMPAREFQRHVDKWMDGKNKSKRYGSCSTGQVLTQHLIPTDEVFAFGKYIVTGSMRGGFVKKDMKYGPRLTGYAGGSVRPGLPWAGDE